MMNDQYRDWQVRMCSQALVTVVHGVVLRERTSLKQPAQVLQPAGKPGCLGVGAHDNGWQYLPSRGIT